MPTKMIPVGDFWGIGPWPMWPQDNFYGGSATKRIVTKEPSLTEDWDILGERTT